ncbi:Ig-like domain-containing protein [bacterium]|nr:Ig-like domain-containing protein [bacterium]
MIITPEQAEIIVGEEVQFTAQLQDEDKSVQEPEFKWSVQNKKIGVISDSGLFTALAAGHTKITATSGKSTGRAEVIVRGDPAETHERYKVIIEPGQAELFSGMTQHFKAWLMDREGMRHDTVFTWSVRNADIGTIDQDGLFEALKKGHTFVDASVGPWTGKSSVVVHIDSATWAWREAGAHVEVTPRDTVLLPGETLQYEAMLMDSAGNPIETVFEWSMDDLSFGSIDENGLFEAIADGKGFVYATTGSFSGKAHVVVKDTTSLQPEGQPKEGRKMVILPKDTLVLVDADIQYQAFIVDTVGNSTKVLPHWRLIGNTVGELSETGLFLAEKTGNGVIKARWQNYTATTRIRVTTADDSAKGKWAKFLPILPDGSETGQEDEVRESGVVTIDSLPFPLNVLNGAQVALPTGSLSDSVSIEVSIPSLADILEDTVSYASAILSGISFNVYVDSQLVSPYYFEEPVQVTIPYNPELLDELGLTVDDLWVFFYTDSAGFDSLDVYNVVVDTTENKVYVEVSHFSEIILGSKSLAKTTFFKTSNTPPAAYALYKNYPNPFNPVTTIRFDVAGQENQHIRLTIYNMLGQQVCTLMNRSVSPGQYTIQWNGLNERNQTVASGIYIYRLQSKQFNMTRRMVLIR